MVMLAPPPSFSANPSDADTLNADQLQAMRWKEISAYGTFDYLDISSSSSSGGGSGGTDIDGCYSPFPKKRKTAKEAHIQDEGESQDGDEQQQIPLICPQWREVICDWAYKLVDHFDASREAVGIGMHFVDRYLGAIAVVEEGNFPATTARSSTTKRTASPTSNTDRIPMSKRDFKLLCLTCLHLAFKMDRPTTTGTATVSLDTILEVSKDDKFDRDQIMSMERQVLHKLQWRLNPPTSFGFLMSYHDLLLLKTPKISTRSSSCCCILDDYYSETILENARFLVELSVIDYYFVQHRPSHIAIASLLISMEDVYDVAAAAESTPVVCLPRHHDLVSALLSWLDHPSKEIQDIMQCKVRLRAIQSNVIVNDDEPEEEEEAEDTASMIMSTAPPPTTSGNSPPPPPCSSEQTHFQQWHPASPSIAADTETIISYEVEEEDHTQVSPASSSSNSQQQQQSHHQQQQSQHLTTNLGIVSPLRHHRHHHDDEVLQQGRDCVSPMSKVYYSCHCEATMN